MNNSSFLHSYSSFAFHLNVLNNSYDRMHLRARSVANNGHLMTDPAAARPDGMGDEMSLHAACAVANGTKWAANKWVHNVPYTGM